MRNQSWTSCADYIRDILTKVVGRQIPIRPVVVYPGWFVERQPRGATVWVLNEKALPSFILHEDIALAPIQVGQLAQAIDVEVRRRYAE